MKGIKYFVLGLLLVFSRQLAAQEPVPSVEIGKNWTSNIIYDFAGTTLAKNVSYFNIQGFPIQNQSWDVLTGRVWLSQSLYDNWGRNSVQTLNAPAGNNFGYRPNFMLSNSQALTGLSFEPVQPGQNLLPLDDSPNTLGWYYSMSNTLDPFQDGTLFPYSRIVFSKLNPGSAKEVWAGNKIYVNGEDKYVQTYTFSMPMETIEGNLTAHYRIFDGKKIIKTVTRDVHNIETVVFSDTDGNFVGTARSGNEEVNGNVRDVYVEINETGIVDIHIPVGCGSDVIIEGTVQGYGIRIYDLVTEEMIYDHLTGYNQVVNLAPGFYRFEDVGVSQTFGNGYDPNNPIRIHHKVNYYDLSFITTNYKGEAMVVDQPEFFGTARREHYEYNTLGQLLKADDPDKGIAKARYRSDGQIRFSQTSEQALQGHLSYTNYDYLGRPIESGLYTKPIDIESIDQETTDMADGLSADREQQTFTVYDEPDDTLYEELAKCGIPSADYTPTFLSGNVSYTYTKNPTTSRTWYSYDVFGRLTWMVQRIEGTDCIKTIDYEYDPANGNVVSVIYQKHKAADMFIHKYEYNAAGQLTKVDISPDNVTYYTQAEYLYNEAGQLIRTVLAEDLQGIDYVYNIAGKLKAINHPSLDPERDPGRDGTIGSGVAADAFGMGIDYYRGDYNRPNAPADISSTPDGISQFNGNINATRWKSSGDSQQSAYLYQYNKNNWMKLARFGTTDNYANISLHPKDDYLEGDITYDANGNITQLIRHGHSEGIGNNLMDHLTYKYLGNKLLYVKDTEDNSDPLRFDDIKDQEVAIPTGQVVQGIPIMTLTDNYIYNTVGQCILNLQERIGYDYYTNGLVRNVNAFSTEDTEQFITLDFESYPLLISTRRTWSGCPAELLPANICNTLPDPPFSTYMMCLKQENVTSTNPYVSRTRFRIASNSFNRIELDAAIDNILQLDLDTTGPNGDLIFYDDEDFYGATIVPDVTFRLRLPDGTAVASYSVTPQTSQYCDRFFTTHVSLDYVAGNEEFLILEMEARNNLTAVSAGHQRVFVDNISVKVAQDAKVTFYYNERGQRVRKDTYLAGDGIRSTWYVRDLSGVTLGVYSATGGPATTPQPFRCIENTIAGLGRIGIWKRTTGKYGGYALYELTDHLGNVRVVLAKDGNAAWSITNKTDYYPFGMPMPNKTTTDGNYRYNFQGQEKDPETNMEAFELRLWDARLGRWLTVDPYAQHFSPYLGLGNNPVSRVDPDGGMDGDPGDPPIWERVIGWFRDMIPWGSSSRSGTSQAPREETAPTNNWLSEAFSLNTWMNPQHHPQGQEDFYKLLTAAQHGKEDLQKVREGMENIPFMGAWFSFGIDDDPGMAAIQLGGELIPAGKIFRFAKGGANFLKFGGDEAVVHFGKHADQIMKVTGKSAYNLKNYVDDANWIIQNGTYSSKLNGYYHYMGNAAKGESLFGFVGLKNGGSTISTFHIKTATQLGLK